MCKYCLNIYLNAAAMNKAIMRKQTSMQQQQQTPIISIDMLLPEPRMWALTVLLALLLMSGEAVGNSCCWLDVPADYCPYTLPTNKPPMRVKGRQ